MIPILCIQFSELFVSQLKMWPNLPTSPTAQPWQPPSCVLVSWAWHFRFPTCVRSCSICTPASGFSHSALRYSSLPSYIPQDTSLCSNTHSAIPDAFSKRLFCASCGDYNNNNKKKDSPCIKRSYLMRNTAMETFKLPYRRLRQKYHSWTNSSWSSKEGDLKWAWGVRKGFKNKVTFEPGAEGCVSIFHRKDRKKGLPGRKSNVYKDPVRKDAEVSCALTGKGWNGKGGLEPEGTVSGRGRC